ncbi:hypothetical protein [Desulfobulbus alkaliphilus]|uniref:hypothetical protein n=1 Tax=Desulfobulbus alkaliphilus TaxID=869814 RepID=UPI0019644E97|nr:hypothetical protein [Desulfobulbus alkaliphilus]MBM9538506.1 hypothetical protein [Desulfobulbus alkaliphilus]
MVKNGQVGQIFGGGGSEIHRRWHAERHLAQCDYKAAAIYARSAFEKEIRQHCEKMQKKVVFKSQLKKYSTEDFWNAIKGDLPLAMKYDIETYRSLVLNTFSH